MWGAKAGNAQKPFRQQAIALADALHGFARYLSGSDSDADDLVQETYARAFAAAEQFTPGSNLKAWLYRILRNLFVDRHRRRNRGPVSEVSLDDADSQSVLAARTTNFDANAVTSADVESAMMALPESSRTVILLDLEGLSESEAAAILGCPVGTVKSRLFRARTALRELLRDYAPARSVHGL
jgi:RNA polymerase sigma-70 factor (ECF subfamily)